MHTFVLTTVVCKMFKDVVDGIRTGGLWCQKQLFYPQFRCPSVIYFVSTDPIERSIKVTVCSLKKLETMKLKKRSHLSHLSNDNVGPK